MSKRMVDLEVEDGKITSINGYEIATSGGSGGSGGGNYNVKVTSETYETWVGSNITTRWDGSHGLKANTAYEIGDQVQVYIQTSFRTKSVDSNQILVPVSINLSASSDRSKMQFGGVIIVLTNTNTVLASETSTVTNQQYNFSSANYLTYTVIKAGTTGENVTLPSSGFDISIKYMIGTLGSN